MTVLVVLPGLDATATLHAEFAAAVAPVFAAVEVIAYPPDQPLDYQALEALVRARLPAATPFVLLGESFSGPVALAIAADPPANLVGLVLSTTFARAPRPRLSVFAPLTSLAPVRAMPGKLLAWWLLGRWTTPALRTALAAALRQVDPAVLRFRAALAMRADATATLQHIAVPVLCLRARGDRLLPATAALHLLAGMPQARVSDIDGPHLLLQALPREAARAVVSWMKDIGVGSPP